MQSLFYDYELPEELIANAPADPRDSARLLIFKTQTGEIVEDTFTNIAEYIPKDSLLVLNDTKVVPARIEFTKVTGGKVRILFLVNEWHPDEIAAMTIKGLSDRKLNVGDVLFIDGRAIVEALSKHAGEFTFKLLISLTEFKGLMEKIGHTPLPPYIHSTLSETEAREKYQTVFSKEAASLASVAAPTASLHFTDHVFHSLAAKNVEKAFVTLHVGRGTFLPVHLEVGKASTLHEEPINVSKSSAELVAKAKREGRAIIAAGTTATRVLESTADLVLNGSGFSGATSVFIKPPYDFKVIDAMITNFHLPNTSLLMLLDAFLQYKKSPKNWRDIYQYAIENKFRFYSFGDAMLVL